jgi:hypothetical protein
MGMNLDIVADFFKTGLKLKNGGYLKRGELNVPEILFDEIETFSLKSTRIYGMGSISRKANWQYLFKVDFVGYNLRSKLSETIPELSVRYFSPGLNRFLEDAPKMSHYRKKLGVIGFFSKLMFEAFYKDDWDEFAKGK